jgi:6-phosphogluconate dehydrogenase
MAQARKEFGVVGLGNIGGNLTAQALEKGCRVIGYDKRETPQNLVDAGMVSIPDISGFGQELSRPRVVFLYVPAGPVVDSILGDIERHLDQGDVVVDGGNSYWGDSIRRYERLKERGLQFVDLGTSGGLPGASEGACFMAAGGEREAVAHVEPILVTLAVEGGYVHAGPSGAGHFVKLVHNGIEFGMLQAIAEGVDLLEHYREPLPIADVLRCWGRGSVIRSWLVELMEQEYRAKGGLGNIPAYVEDTGEVNWLIDDALHLEVPVPVIAQSVMQLLLSRDKERNWARSVAMMRHGFGNHPFGADDTIANHRREGRIGGFLEKRRT